MADLQSQFEQYFQRFVPDFGCVMVAEIDEVVAASRSTESFAYPLLHIDVPKIILGESVSSMYATYVTTGYVIVKSDNFPARSDVRHAAMAKLEAVIGRMKQDSYDHVDLVEFTVAGAEIEAIRPLFVDDALGWQFKFSFKMNAGAQLCTLDND